MDELIDALVALGHEVVVVGPARTQDVDFGRGDTLVATMKKRLPKVLYETMELGYNAMAFVRLVRAVRRHRPDAVYERYALYMLAGGWLRRIGRTPLLLEVNSPMFEEREAFEGGFALRRVASWSQRSAWRAADTVLPVTDVLADYVRKAGVANDRITVAPNGIDPLRFDPDLPSTEVRRELGLGDRLILGFTGFVREWHGVDRVLALLPSLRRRFDVHLLVVGDGPARGDLERQAAALGVADRFTVTGTVSRDRIAQHVAAFDIALQIGVTPYASPLKLVEYMAMGRAIIAPDTDNIREVLTDGVDAVLFGEDGADLGTAIDRLAADAELRRRLGQSARRAIDEKGLTWRANAERVAAIVERIAGEGQPRRFSTMLR